MLCLLARRLLLRQPSLRLVLMSATLHCAIFADYFCAAVGPPALSPLLHVGARRFGLSELFLEDVAPMMAAALPERLRKVCARVKKL